MDDGSDARKKRVEAACRVGAAFVQRRVLRRWRFAAIASIRERQAVADAQRAVPDGSSGADNEQTADDCACEGDDAALCSSASIVAQDGAEWLDGDAAAEYLVEADAIHEQTAAVAFLAWQQWTRAMRFLGTRAVSAVWVAWREQAQQSARQELLRRRAAQFAYLRALRRSLAQLQALVDAQRARRVSLSLRSWVAYTRERRAKHGRLLKAVRHAQRQAMRRVLRLGLGANVARIGAKRLADSLASAFARTRVLDAAFRAWRAFLEREMRRRQALEALLHEWRQRPSNQSRQSDRLRLTLAGWADYARSKSVARLVVANFRGRAHLRVLRDCLSAWTAHVSRSRWYQIKRERARAHLRRSTLSKSLALWRQRTAAIRKARSQTRAALMHWKLSVEKRALARWIAYVKQKSEKRQHLHDALQFRHSQLVTQGVRQWLTAAMHLQELRETHAARAQAAHAARGSAYALEASASPLSEFVMLPRNRPQPRKPVELMLAQPQHQQQYKAEEDDWGEAKGTAGSDSAVDAATDWPRELARYGFQFPVGISDSPAHIPDAQARIERRQEQPVKGFAIGVQSTQATGISHASPGLGPVVAHAPSAGSRTDPGKYAPLLDALEQQLLRLQTRKREWREFQQRLADLRASRSLQAGGSSEQHQLDQQRRFEEQVVGMEREFQARHRDWHDAQQRLRQVSAELAQLRQELQLQVSS